MPNTSKLSSSKRGVTSRREAMRAVGTAVVSSLAMLRRLAAQFLRDLRQNLSEMTVKGTRELGQGGSPAIRFYADPLGESLASVTRNSPELKDAAAPTRPADEESIAFLPVHKLAQLIRTKKLGAVELTRIYLDRLHRYDELLKFVVTFTDDLALKQAEEADQEIAAGRYRGPLHGIPWGAKDLISYPGYPTTWGAASFKEQILDTKATVAERLEDAGAILVAKLSMGALAMGDEWFDQKTRNPWDPRQGSGGSSAGSGSAVAAGAVGFAIGTETLGSILEPSRRCGVTGLRPTFGRVSRYGCMTLAWSLDKLGPMARSVADTALVLDAIHGADSRDPTAINRSFVWPPTRKVSSLRVGVVESEWDDREDVQSEEDPIVVLRNLGVELVPITIPTPEDARPACFVLDVECATVFDNLTRNELTNTQDLKRFPDIYRTGHFISGVEYLRAMRIRTQLMQQMTKSLKDVDLYIAKDDLALTNLTGHPSISMPWGFRDNDGRRVPNSVTFTGKPFDEATLLTLAAAFQHKTAPNPERPPLDTFLANQPQNE